MGPRLLPPRPQDPETMQGAMVRMAGPWHPEDRVVKGGGREAAASGEADAHAVAHHRAYCGQDGDAVFGKVSEVAG